MGPRALPPVRSPLRLLHRGASGRAALAVPALPSLRTDPVDRTAEAVWCGLIAAGLGWDYWLVRTGRRTLSEATRCPIGAAAIGGLLLHFAGLLGRYDPLCFAADHIPRRTP